MLSGERGSRSEARSESKHPYLKVLLSCRALLASLGTTVQNVFELRGFWFMLETNRACSSGG